MISNPCSFLRRIRAVPAGAWLVLCALPSAPACGPDFPNAYLVGDPELIGGLPTLSFAGELERLLPPRTERPAESESAAATPAVDPAELAEVGTVLAAGGLSPTEVKDRLPQYSRTAPFAALPKEFHLYGQGARAWHAGERDAALAAWRELLSLPEKERHYRTVWAQYMIGRGLEGAHPAEARAAYQAARYAARSGFADSIGLATASLGWDARLLLEGGQLPEAIDLYFQQFAAGDATAGPSLQRVLQQVFTDSVPAETTAARLREIASTRERRGIVSAWFVSRGGPHAPWSGQAAAQFRQWLAALPAATGLEPAEADRWAWAAYQNGLWDEAEAFARAAAADAPAAEWVRAMLHLRQGDVHGAVEHLTGAARAFPTDRALQSDQFSGAGIYWDYSLEDTPSARLGGVRGVLALQREQYLEALRLFLAAGHWSDAAYVAERVLTVDELKTFVSDEIPAPPATPEPDAVARSRSSLRHLLARRLVRTGQFDAARAFFPAELAATYDRYVAAVRRGYDDKLNHEQRAAAFFDAAQLARTAGLELQGTELTPDFAIWGGSFQWPDIAETRIGEEKPWWYRRDGEAVSTQPIVAVLRANDAERERVEHSPVPTRRFHYRHRAADLAFLAATLLPDEDERTAEVLNTAGRWIAPRYPEDAQLFYRMLVLRCGTTALGQEANARHWLVPDGVVPTFESEETDAH